jgi:hypothetical protein
MFSGPLLQSTKHGKLASDRFSGGTLAVYRFSGGTVDRFSGTLAHDRVSGGTLAIDRFTRRYTLAVDRFSGTLQVTMTPEKLEDSPFKYAGRVNSPPPFPDERTGSVNYDFCSSSCMHHLYIFCPVCLTKKNQYIPGTN